MAATFNKKTWEREFKRLQREIDDVFEEVFGIKRPPTSLRQKFSYLKGRLDEAFTRLKERLGRDSERELIIPAADVLEYNDNYRFYLELPGVKKSNLDVRVIGRELSVRGKGKIDGNNRSALNREIEYGDYYRIFELPGNVDPVKIQAKLEDGLLTIDIPVTDGARYVEVIG